MGYTHYWSIERKPTDSEWTAFMEAAAKIITTAKNSYFINLAWEFDEPTRKPEVSMGLIRFNGIDEDGHETFYFERKVTDFQFCKTARKDYDAPVTAILIAAKQYLGSAFDWRSDGYGISAVDGSIYNDHGDGLKLYNEAMGASLDNTNASKERS